MCSSDLIDPQSGLGERDRDLFHPDVLELGHALRDVETQAAHRGGEIKTGRHDEGLTGLGGGEEVGAAETNTSSMVWTHRDPLKIGWCRT